MSAIEKNIIENKQSGIKDNSPMKGNGLHYKSTTVLSDSQDENIHTVVNDPQLLQFQLKKQGEELQKAHKENQETRNQLKKISAKYSSMYDSAPFGDFTSDRNGLIQEINLTAVNLLGKESGSPLNTKFYDYIVRDDWEKFHQHLKNVFKTGKQQRCEIKLNRNNKTEYNALIDSITVEENNGNYCKCRNVFFDISEKKYHEDVLIQSEKKWQAIVKNIPFTITMIDIDGTILFLNRNNKIIGNDSNIGKNLYNFINPLHHNIVRQTIEYVIQSKKTKTCETTRKNINGQLITYENSFNPIIQNNKVFEISILTNDINDKIQFYDAIRKTEKQNHLIIGNLIDGIWAVDTSFQLSYTSLSMKKLLGYTINEEIPQKIKDLISPESLQYARKVLKKEMKRIINLDDIKRIITLELNLKCKNGSTILTESKVTSFINTEGHPIGIIGVSRNIMKERKLQEKLIHNEKYSTIIQLTAGIAHEINNFLTIIIGFTQFSLAENSINRIKLSLEKIKLISKNCGDLVKELSYLSRYKEPDFRMQNITTVIDEVLKEHETKLLFNNIIIKKEYMTHSKLLFDKNMIETVISNILINAIHAIMIIGNGLITISVKDTGNHTKIKFSDTGTGIEDRVLPNIFNAFFTTKKRWPKDGMEISGYGLGLYISQTIIEQHNGIIEVESEINKGSTFIITLPTNKAIIDNENKVTKKK